jgi:hypothetical protein
MYLPEGRFRCERGGNSAGLMFAKEATSARVHPTPILCCRHALPPRFGLPSGTAGRKSMYARLPYVGSSSHARMLGVSGLWGRMRMIHRCTVCRNQESATFRHFRQLAVGLASYGPCFARSWRDNALGPAHIALSGLGGPCDRQAREFPQSWGDPCADQSGWEIAVTELEVVYPDRPPSGQGRCISSVYRT